MCRGANDAIIPRLAFDSFAEKQWSRMAVGTPIVCMTVSGPGSGETRSSASGFNTLKCETTRSSGHHGLCRVNPEGG